MDLMDLIINFLLFMFFTVLIGAGESWVFRRAVMSTMADETRRSHRVGIALIWSIFLAPGFAVGHGVAILPASLVTVGYLIEVIQGETSLVTPLIFNAGFFGATLFVTIDEAIRGS